MCAKCIGGIWFLKIGTEDLWVEIGPRLRDSEVVLKSKGICY